MLDFQAMISAIGPELLLALAGLLGVLAGAVMGDRFNAISFKLGAATLVLAALVVLMNWDGGTAFGGLVTTGPFVNFAKVVSFLAGAATLLMGENFLKRHETIRYEYPLLVIFASLGMGIILSASNLMTLYMGIETLSLSSYVLASFHRDSIRSSEAGLKYFVLGALASGLLLYGISLVYGFTGSTAYADIAGAERGIGLLFGMVLMISGMAFKVSAAPMHVWTPDVYEGAPSPVVAFFATAPKMASMVVFANLLFSAFPGVFADWQLIIAIIATLSMVIGAFGALNQTNLKRLLGYSSIANMGYALVAVASGAEFGAAALLVFMTTYVIASIGLFGGVMSMRREGGMVENIDELSGLVRRRTGMALALTVLLISVAGFPLAVGFLGKLVLFEAGWNAGLLPLLIILVLSSVLAFGYYLRIILIMWVKEPAESFQPVDTAVSSAVYLSAAACLALFVFISPFIDWATRASAGFMQ
ncbi:MAG: NADH-quinone oxidoreductase subunit N [Henriciella sp.]|jgi:NADH-quinone oxidoreductase subunit N|uniref:NADH-quinone oxidoreductase subunit N n=1 Tax=Henriciella sp. TaxID=1968823 RepID=UPI000C0D3E6B|nr:NADH-quinone oxidoreductase subunit N [Henriciella sp.]MAN73331.1 NADH-quinone oxidoreductase subunit N [Henriciella sp.]MBF33409.1 NADH-quinone oxidoreductase subunit N [Hyphomonadaceae bacterium]PHR82160.1 MAG: NADH-quinone oxidoreductase subunit N [Henriciella sp.]|tara:strand:+ start:14107 stop:15531 length:1425 start_codon:yes stop_codon:yes gene_type:complete